MNNPYLADFYHGWIIEVTRIESGFQAMCYSPSRKRIYDSTSYSCEFEALSIAKKRISHHTACYTLVGVLRELYEGDRLVFEDWRSLNQSLSEMAIAS